MMVEEFIWYFEGAITRHEAWHERLQEDINKLYPMEKWEDEIVTVEKSTQTD